MCSEGHSQHLRMRGVGPWGSRGPEPLEGSWGGESQVYSPKSIPSDTLPRATDSRMAPRPFSQACGGEGSRGGAAAPQSCHFAPPQPLFQHPPCHPHTHLLVLLQGDTGLSPILGLNKEQLVPLDVFEDALGKDTRPVRVWRGSRRVKFTGVLAKLNCAGFPGNRPPPSPAETRREGARARLISFRESMILVGN